MCFGYFFVIFCCGECVYGLCWCWFGEDIEDREGGCVKFRSYDVLVGVLLFEKWKGFDSLGCCEFLKEW